MPPSLTRPSYRLASYSGMPFQSCTGEPSHCASDPRTSECSHDRSSRNEWPEPGMAKAPMPTSHPKALPTRLRFQRPPLPLPVPLCSSRARNLSIPHFPKQNEMSVFRNPAAFRHRPRFPRRNRWSRYEYGCILACHENSPFMSGDVSIATSGPARPSIR